MKDKIKRAEPFLLVVCVFLMLTGNEGLAGHGSRSAGRKDYAGCLWPEEKGKEDGGSLSKSGQELESGSLDKASMIRREKELNAEFNLAKKQQFYFVLDLTGKKLDLRVKGMKIKEWEIDKIRFWGAPAFEGESGAVELVSKSAMNVPERNIIKPGEAAEPETEPENPAEFELSALELDDMPVNFGLNFQTGLRIRIRTAGKVGLWGSFYDSIRRNITVPVRSFVLRLKGKALSEIEMTFADDKSAASIYWIFFEGIEGIIR